MEIFHYTKHEKLNVEYANMELSYLPSQLYDSQIGALFSKVFRKIRSIFLNLANSNELKIYLVLECLFHKG